MQRLGTVLFVFQQCRIDRRLRVGYFEPLLLATMACRRLAGGESDGALSAVERIEAVLVRAEEVAHASAARAFAPQIERARTPSARPRAAEQVR